VALLTYHEDDLSCCSRDTDPGHHILDTLEQCIAIIVEKAALGGGDGEQAVLKDGQGDGEEEEELQPPANTKIIYFMPR
jgi:hypothetical protein